MMRLIQDYSTYLIWNGKPAKLYVFFSKSADRSNFVQPLKSITCTTYYYFRSAHVLFICMFQFFSLIFISMLSKIWRYRFSMYTNLFIIDNPWIILWYMVIYCKLCKCIFWYRCWLCTKTIRQKLETPKGR